MIASSEVRINLATMDETVNRLASDAQSGKGFTVFTLNLDHLVKLRFDKLFRAAYTRAKICHRRWLACGLAGAAQGRCHGAHNRGGSRCPCVRAGGCERPADLFFLAPAKNPCKRQLRFFKNAFQIS